MWRVLWIGDLNEGCHEARIMSRLEKLIFAILAIYVIKIVSCKFLAMRWCCNFICVLGCSCWKGSIYSFNARGTGVGISLLLDLAWQGKSLSLNCLNIWEMEEFAPGEWSASPLTSTTWCGRDGEIEAIICTWWEILFFYFFIPLLSFVRNQRAFVILLQEGALECTLGILFQEIVIFTSCHTIVHEGDDITQLAIQAAWAGIDLTQALL